MSDGLDGGQRPRLSRWWYLVPVGFALLALLLLVRAAGDVIRTYADEVVPFADGRAEVRMDPGDTRWVVAPVADRTGGVSCAASVDGVGVPIQALSTQTVTVDDVEWTGIASFEAADGGLATVQCTTGRAAAQLALVPDPNAPGGFRDDLRAALTWAGFGATFLIASAISAWLLIRRARSTG